MVDPSLQRLARLHGVQVSYRDGFGRVRRPHPEVLLAVLRELGAELVKPEDVPHELRRGEIKRWERMVEPVSVAWQAARTQAAVRLRLPAALGAERFEVVLEGEACEPYKASGEAGCLHCLREVSVHGRQYLLLELPLSDRPLRAGYYRYQVSVAGRQADGLLVCAPRTCADLQPGWGAFAPLHALHSLHSAGIGTFAELGRLSAWLGGLGGGFVSTLPLLASFLDEPFAPSPYMPISRCFWNEIYVDLPSVPEWAPACGGIGAEPAGRHIDYRALMRVKRAGLERSLARLRGQRRESFIEFVQRNAELRAYAAFRAGVDRTLAQPPLFDLQDAACAYHAYAQWIAEEQVGSLSRACRESGQGLYLDLPLGVHPHGFDSHRHADLFARHMTGGAPPDRFFSKGQNWGFAPLNPRQARERRHAYWIACIRHHMRHAGILRVDHLMGLHRLYWIPDQCAGDQGVYVQYPAAELYAILCLESRRSGTAVVGEDLGTVPRYVRQRMADHGLRRMYVGQFEYEGHGEPPGETPPRQSVASLNTHDTAMFASFWTDQDIQDQVSLGLLDADHAAQARGSRRRLRAALLNHLRERRLIDGGEPSSSAVLRACLTALAASDAECVIVTLEDLWGETEPQNTPGTDRERPNWTRRMQRSLEQIESDPQVAEVLANLSRVRRSAERDWQ